LASPGGGAAAIGHATAAIGHASAATGQPLRGGAEIVGYDWSG
jgi:hypothetical protein